MMHFPDEETLVLIRWWENELTGEDRTFLMGGYMWHGPEEERHNKLREMRVKWDNTSIDKQTKGTGE